MPKSYKAAPPQQSSLTELWAKKKPGKPEVMPEVKQDETAAKAEDDMEVDGKDANEGMGCWSITLFVTETRLGETSERKDVAPSPPPKGVHHHAHGNLAGNLLPAGPSRHKRRRVVESDDDGDVNMPSSPPGPSLLT